MTKFYDYAVFVRVLKPCNGFVSIEPICHHFTDIDTANDFKQYIEKCGLYNDFTVWDVKLITTINDIEF